VKAESIDQLLEAERGRKGFSQVARAGLWKGIESSIGIVVAPGAGADANAPPEAKAPPDAKAPDATPPDATPPADLGGAAKRFASLKIGALVAVAALGGAGVGAAAHARWAEPRVVFVPRAVEPALPPLPEPSVSVASVAPLAPSVAPPEGSRVAARPVAAAKSAAEPRAVAPAAPSPRDPGLARERTLLDMARTALSRGDTAAALSAVDSHAREFPSSQLAEEREVLAIQALASASRTAEARRRGAAFRASFPKSALLPIVEEATQ
jgi:hypothetical protein